MTTTDYSRALCEICGIKPIYKCRNVPCLNFCVGGDCQLKEFEACNPLHCSEYVPDTKSKKWKDGIAIYPNFTKPENFVKLLRIANDILGKVHFATAYSKNSPNLFEEQAIMHYMPIAKLNDNFKQAIREQEWSYE